MTRGEAQAQLDDFLERTSTQTVADMTRAQADRFAEGTAVYMAGIVFPYLESQGTDEAEACAVALAEIAEMVNGLVQLAISAAVELGGNDVMAQDRDAFKAFVAARQTEIDEMSDEEPDDEPTRIILPPGVELNDVDEEATA